jgi:hypothetical protein
MISSLSEVDTCISSLLLESIDEVLVNLLGEGVTQAIYARLEGQGLKKQQIREDLPRFDAFLEETCGRASEVIERQVAKRFYTLLGLVFVKVPDYALTDYIEEASRRLSAGRKIGPKTNPLATA